MELTPMSMKAKIVIQLTRESEKGYLYSMSDRSLILMACALVMTQFNRIDVMLHGNVETPCSRLPMVCEGQALTEM